MRLLIILTFVLGTLYGSENPEKEFIKFLFNEPHDLKDAWSSYNTTRKDPNGGYIFKFTIQTKSNVKLFYAFNGYGDEKSNSPQWFLYDTLDGFNYKKSAILRIDELYYNYQTQLISFYSPNQRENSGHLILTDVNTLVQSHIEIGYNEQWALQLYQERFEFANKFGVDIGLKFNPKIEKMPLGTYLRTGKTNWNSYINAYHFTAQSLDPEDSHKIDAIGDLSFTEGLALLNNLGDISINDESKHIKNEYELIAVEGILDKDIESINHQKEVLESTERQVEKTSQPNWLIIFIGISLFSFIFLLIKLLRAKCMSRRFN